MFNFKRHVAFCLFVILLLLLESVVFAQGKGCGTVYITSEPKGAIVYLAGKSLGITPLVITGLPLRTYCLLFFKDGYKKVTKEIKVNSVLAVRADIRLTKESITQGSLQLDSTPPKAKVYIRKTFIGLTPLFISGLPSLSPQQITVVKDGYRKTESFVKIKSKQPAFLKVKLVPLATGKTETKDKLFPVTFISLKLFLDKIKTDYYWNNTRKSLLTFSFGRKVEVIPETRELFINDELVFSKAMVITSQNHILIAPSLIEKVWGKKVFWDYQRKKLQIK